MVILHISSGVNIALFILLLFLFKQYLQSKMQQFVINIFKREIHLPSLAKEWQIPEILVEPSPSLFFLEVPLEEQDASYLALSAKIFNFSCKSICITKHIISENTAYSKQKFVLLLWKFFTLNNVYIL